MSNELITYKGHVFTPDNVEGLIRGYKKVSVREAVPTFAWEGGRITLDVWHQVLSFFEWSNKDNDEAQVRLFYHKGERRWCAWAFPQRGVGMTTSETNNEEFQKQRKELGSDWIDLGTAHHHCKGTAFQSGCDENDETTRDGIHLTVGKIGSSMYDLHGRVYYWGQSYEVDWLAWFDVLGDQVNGLFKHMKGMPKEAVDKMYEAINSMVKHTLCTPAPKDTAFPEIWKTNFEKKAYTPSYHGVYTGPREHHGYSTPPGGTGYQTKWTKKSTRSGTGNGTKGKDWEAAHKFIQEASASLGMTIADYSGYALDVNEQDFLFRECGLDISDFWSLCRMMIRAEQADSKVLVSQAPQKTQTQSGK